MELVASGSARLVGNASETIFSLFATELFKKVTARLGYFKTGSTFESSYEYELKYSTVNLLADFLCGSIDSLVFASRLA